MDAQKKQNNIEKEQEIIKIPQNPPKILLIQDTNEINGIWAFGTYWENYDTSLYNKTYGDTLKKYLGIDLQIIPSSELIKGMENSPKEQVEEITNKWINEAEAIVEVEKEDIIKVGKMYIAVKNLLDKYNANAWSLRSWRLIDSTLCMPPLAEMQSYLDGIPTCCEGLADDLVAQMTGTYISGKPGFVGDAINYKKFKLKPGFKHPEDVVIIGHCYMPVNPHGNDRVSYMIRSHVIGNPNATVVQDKHPGFPFVANWVHWPVEETVTLLKFNVFEKQISVFTGKIVDGDFYYKDFEETMCRDKLTIKVDNYQNCYMFPISKGDEYALERDFMEEGGQKVNSFRKLGKWGAHQVVFCGDYKNEIIKLADLIGFDVTTAEEVIKNPERKLKDNINIAKIISNPNYS